MDIRNYITQCNLECTSCEYKNTLCRDINYLNSKDKALTSKHKIYLTRRNYENTKSVEPDLVLELFNNNHTHCNPCCFGCNYRNNSNCG